MKKRTAAARRLSGNDRLAANTIATCSAILKKRFGDDVWFTVDRDGAVRVRFAQRDAN